MNGASTANGAIVMIRKSTTRPRAWSTDVLKKIVPASAMVTNASAAPLTAVISMSVARPVRPAPCAPVIRCTKRPVPRVALPLAWVPDLNARPVAWAASPSSPQRIGHPHRHSILGLRHCDEPQGVRPPGRPSRYTATGARNWQS